MARIVENVFVDVTSADERPLLAQHQKHFRGNVIARWTVAARTYVKVPYLPSEATRAAGETVTQFKVRLGG